MRAVLYRLRGTLRRRWWSVLAVAAAIAVVTGAVLALAAGARRTAHAPDAFTRAVGGEIDGTVSQPFGVPRTEEIASLAGVRSVATLTFTFGLITDPDPQARASLVFTGDGASTTRIVSGRLPDPSVGTEFVGTRQFARERHAKPGDRFSFVSWTREQIEADGPFVGDPLGPAFEVEMVGIVDAPQTLEDEFAPVIFSPALRDTGVVQGMSLMAVRLEPGVTTSELRSELDALPDSGSLAFDPGPLLSDAIRNGVEGQARGIWIMAGVAALAALVTLGQLLTRHARLAAGERRPLAAIGFTTGQLIGEGVGRAAVPAALGVVGGAGLAYLASDLFPTGFVRPLEPSPGLRLDSLVLVGGVALLVIGLLAWVCVALLVTGRGREHHSLSSTTETLARHAPTPAAATGVRFALSGRSRSRAPAAGTLALLALLAAGLVGAAAFAASLNRLVTNPARFGNDYDFVVGAERELSSDELHTALDDDPDVSGLAVIRAAQVRAGEASVGLTSVEHLRGDVSPPVLSGRLPSGPDELALGRVTARDLHAGIGDRIELSGSLGDAGFLVVGVAVVPGIAGHDGVGVGGVVTPAGLARVAEPDSFLAAVALRDGAPADAGQRIAAMFGDQPGLEDPPATILNVGRIRRVPDVLAALLAALALLTIVHALIVSIQSRRRDVAVLRALGADRRWVARAVHWQATVLVALPLVIGVPLGVLAGSVVFRAFVDRIGAVPDPVIPVLAVAALGIAFVVIANLAAVVPAWRARRLPAAELLKAE